MKIKVIFIICLLIFLFLGISQKYLFPGDVLNNLPSFSESGWERPKNSIQADPVFQFEPWRKFSKSELLSFKFPLWNDQNGNGAPFFANFQSAVLYPLNFIYYIFSPNFALFLIPIIKLSLFFSFIFLYLRSIKVNLQISLIGSVVLSFSGFMILWLNWPHANVYLLFPLLLFFTEKIRESKGENYRYFIAVVIAYFFAILGGHPETLLYVFIVHILYSIVRIKEKKNILFLFVSVLFAFLLAAVQIIPFLEYLYYSFAFQARTSEVQSFYLPLKSFVYNFYPLILGAPHLSFYRPIDPITNFQEVSGGYVGLIPILFVLIGLLNFFRNFLIKFWFFIVVISWLISYKIWPIGLLDNLPFYSASAHHRLIAFAGFGMIILFCLMLQELLEKKIKLSNKFYFSNKFFFGIVLIIFGISIYSYYYVLGNYEKYAPFIGEYLTYFNIVASSTLLFFWGLISYLKKKISLNAFYIITFFTIISQTLLLFWNYNPFVKSEKYYPEIEIVKVLRQFPKGNILEVGNPSLPANVNLFYEIPNVVNNDAIEISWYKSVFDKDFNYKNNWRNPEEVNLEKLRKFNVNYVISDFDINLKKELIQGKSDKVLEPLLNDNIYELEFFANPGLVKQIRIKTATFNRNNRCNLTIKIFGESKKVLLDKKVNCLDIRNNMFLTIPADLDLSENGKYILQVSSNSRDQDNSVALYGSEKDPYFELLYQNGLKNHNLISKTNSSYIWKIESNEIESPGNIKILFKDSQSLIFETLTSGENILIKKTYFPGWIANVNGKKVEIKNSNPFMLIKTEKGMNYIELNYSPMSFKIGLLISLVTFFVLLLFILRKEYQSGAWRIIKNWLEVLNKKSEKLEFWEHVLVILFGIIIGIISYLIMILNIHPKFVVPYTTTISWFTVNNYPRQQEYFYLFTAFSYISLVTLFVWLLFVWKRKTK